MKKLNTGIVLGALGGILLAVTATAGSRPSGRLPEKCLPFFDYSKDKVVSNVVLPNGSIEQGKVDITPEPIRDNAFGEAALQACGEFGAGADQQAIRKLVEDFNPELMKELAREFSNFNDAQLRAQLLRLWTAAKGFEHVFCGQPRRGKVGGLHYAGRYFELQEKGELCRLNNNVSNEEVLPNNVFTIGVSIPGGIIDRKKGFSIRQSAEDIFFEAARTYLRNCQSPSNNRRVCVSRFYKDGSFGNLFVCAPNLGVVTFYPLAAARRDVPACR